MLELLLFIFLILVLFGAFRGGARWRAPGGILGLILFIVLILALLEVI